MEFAGQLASQEQPDVSERAQHTLLVADIKRFLDRPAEVQKVMPAPDSPPGAPIGGDTGMDWLATPGCTWSEVHPDSWSTRW
jgi:hypothetical protein